MKYRELNEVFEHKKYGMLQCVIYAQRPKGCKDCVFILRSFRKCQKNGKCGVGVARKDGNQVVYVKVKDND